MVHAVAHFVDRYPVGEQAYIYDQVVVATQRRDRLLAARGTINERGDHRFEVGLRSQLPRSALGRRKSDLGDRARARILWARECEISSSFVRHELSRIPADVVHAHFGMAGARLAPLRRKTDVPLVTTFYGVDASACLRNRRWLQRFRPLFDFGDAFVVLSEHVVERLVSAGAPAEKIHVWSIGIDFGQYPYRERKAPGVPVRILCAARFVEKKGHPMLLEAFRLLRKRHDAALTLVGYGPLRDEIRRTASSLGVGSCVTIIDTSKGVDFEVLYPKLLESHDLFALSSTVAADGDDEGGPALTVVCAQATGMPVVVTPFIGAERSVVDRETGLVCDAGAQALSDLLAEVIEDHDLAVSVGRAGATRVRAEFSLEKQRDALEDIYQLAMQGNSQPERREVDRAAQ